MSYFSTMKLGTGSRLDHFMMTYYHHHQSSAISRNTSETTESDCAVFEEKLSTQLRQQRTWNIRNAHHTLFHRLRNYTATTKDTGLRIAALSTADTSSLPVHSDRHSCPKNHKNHNRHRRHASQRQRRRKRVSRGRELYLYLEGG